MTYCCGILVHDGLVMIADTRTNAGLDNISVFRKLHSFAVPGERAFAIASAGNLSVTQSVLSLLEEGLENPSGARETLMNAPTMFQAAQRVGRAIRHVNAQDGGALAAGNFIECTTDTPYLQIGEHKYGKPVLDRAITFDMDLYDALKVGLVSVDSTMRSNLSVGMPIDVVVVRRDACAAELIHRIEPGEPYFADLRERWSAALRAAHANIPPVPYKSDARPAVRVEAREGARTT
jgi:putative proteasome-type protease